ncbi:MAG: hypothetical protein ACLSVG_07040 [Clostridia bacterium]
MGFLKKAGLPKFILFAVPFFILPVLSFFFPILADLFLSSGMGSAAASTSFSGGEFQKTLYNIFFIISFLCGLPISFTLKKSIAEEKRRAVCSAYIAILLLYNAILIPLFLYL